MKVPPRIVFHPDVPPHQQLLVRRASEMRTVLSAAGALVVLAVVGVVALGKAQMGQEATQWLVVGWLVLVGILLGTVALGVVHAKLVARGMFEHQVALRLDDRQLELYTMLEAQILNLGERQHVELYGLLFEQFKQLAPVAFRHEKHIAAQEWQEALGIEEIESQVRELVEAQVELRKAQGPS